MSATRRALGFTLLSLVLGAGTASAQSPAKPVVDPARLAADPAGGTKPAAVFHPTPSPADRWRAGLADILARYETDLAALRARASAVRGTERALAEREIQARKLGFEIELHELQIELSTPPAGAAIGAREAGTEREAAERSLRESVARLRELRGQILAGGRAVLPPAREE